MSSSGIAGLHHLAMELFEQKAGVKFHHKPYKGGAPAIQAVVAGEVALTFSVIGSAKDLAATGRVRPIAIAARKRLDALPGVPTFTEVGIPITAISWVGLMAPRGTPTSVIKRINQLITTSMEDPRFQQLMSDNTMQISNGTPDAFQGLIAENTAIWREVTKSLNLKSK